MDFAYTIGRLHIDESNKTKSYSKLHPMKNYIAIINKPDKSDSFIKYVLELGKDMGAHIHFLYIQTPSEYPVADPVAAENIAMQARKNQVEETRSVLKSIESNISDVKKMMLYADKVTLLTDYGTTQRVTQKLAEEYSNVEFIVEADHQQGFWFQTLTSEDVIEGVDCPVWIVPPNTTYKPFRQIVYATDYVKEDVDTLKNLVSTLGESTPEITALHITDNNDFKETIKKVGFIEMLKTLTKYENINVRSVEEKGKEDTAQLINDYAVMVHADLLVVLKKNKNFLTRLFTKSPTKKLAKETHLPLLVFHQKQ
jgi:nucleotide-binding universal stress UspA family protein